MPQGFNQPALWRSTKFLSFNYPITAIASVQGTKPYVVDLKKYLTGDADYLSRIFVRIHGSITKAGAGVGAATGADNPYNLLVSANLSTSPIFANVVPLNSVSQRILAIDSSYNAGFDPRTAPAVTDAAAVVAVDFTTELNFKRSRATRDGIDYVLALNQYRNATLTLVFGGRDQLFSGGVNTWDLSGLTVDLFADIEMGINPGFIHAHELFENIYPVLASNGNFKIDNLPAGFVYTDLYLLSENAGALTDGILNNIAIANGSQQWTMQGESNALNLRYMFSRDNYRALTGALLPANPPTNDLTGVHAFPLRDGMFTRGFDCRYSPPIITLDVTSLSATTLIRLGGRRMLPGGVYQRPKQVQVK